MNVVDKNGNTALIWAAGHYEEDDDDVDDHWGKATNADRYETIRVLLQAGARVNKSNHIGYNALKPMQWHVTLTAMTN